MQYLAYLCKDPQKKRMQELYVCNKFLISPLERHFKTFQGFSSLFAFYVSIHIRLADTIGDKLSDELT